MTIIKKFEPEQYEEKFPKRYIGFGGILILALIVLEIWANNTMANYGEKLERLSLLQKTLKMENQILENEIAKQASLVSIASKSAELGFSAASSIQYIR